MCICLPNGKFTLNLCIRKRSSKNKLNIFNEINEEEDTPNTFTNKTNGFNSKSEAHLDAGQNQGHYRQLSRDRQLPPVPDLSNDPTLQAISRSNVDLCFISNVAEDFSHQFLTYSPRKCFDTSHITQSSRDSEPIYTKVEPRNKFKNPAAAEFKPNELPNYEYDSTDNKFEQSYLVTNKTRTKDLHEFNSLRKPSKSRALNEQCYQSLQALSNTPPGIPIRQYSPYELPELFGNHVCLNTTTATTTPLTIIPPSISTMTGEPISSNTSNTPNNPGPSEVRRRNPSNSSSSLRRFSQPLNVNPSPNNDVTSIGAINSAAIQKDSDVLKNLQSQYNSPPLNRASIADIRDVPSDTNSEKTEDAVYSIPHKLPQIVPSSPSPSGPPPSAQNPSNVYEMVDELFPNTKDLNVLCQPPSSMITSIHNNNNNNNNNIMPTPPTASLESFSPIITPVTASALSALPNSSNNSSSIIPQTTSSASAAAAVLSASPHVPSLNPVAEFLGHDNYISIAADNTGATGNPTGNPIRTDINNSVLENKPYSPYYTCGSDVYAEISDVYQYRHYEELPDTTSSSGGGVIGSAATQNTVTNQNPRSSLNNSTGRSQPNFITSNNAPSTNTQSGIDPSASPGTLRVLLEIQSFRHMDSDVDISSSRCATPHHPNPSISDQLGSSSSSTAPILKNHPWFAPPPPPPPSSSNTAPRSQLTRHQPPHMTPVMERSVEGSSSLFSTNTNNTTNNNNIRRPVDNLYELFKEDMSTTTDTPKQIVYPKYQDEFI